MIRAKHHPLQLDGVAQLEEIIRRADYRSVAAAVAEHTIFLAPETVAQTHGQALFPVIRDVSRRGQIDLDNGVLCDDNFSPTRAFRWAAALTGGQDIQFNHVWGARSRDRRYYTALWNLCLTPSFLAKTTDGSNHPEVLAALRYHAYSLYGQLPADEPVPHKPAGYDSLAWADHPAPINDLEQALRRHLAGGRNRLANACCQIGWLYSDWSPDPTI